MGEFILYVQGAAVARGAAPNASPEDIAFEDRITDAEIAALSYGEQVVHRIGNAKDGFTMPQFRQAMNEYPHTRTIIISAHGNVDTDEGEHYITASPGDDDLSVYAPELYKTISEHLVSPVNIVMFSCGAHASHKDAVKYLPHGSTSVTFGERNDIASYCVKPASLCLTAEPHENFAEQMFLSMLCRGFGTHENFVMYSVAQPDHEEDPDRWLFRASAWDLWDMAMTQSADKADGTFSRARRRKVHSELSLWLPARKINQAIRAIENYLVGSAYGLQSPVRGMPIIPSYVLNREDYQKQARRNGLLGPICAIGHVLNREETGAFQCWDAERYGKLPKPGGRDVVTVPRTSAVISLDVD